MGLIGGFLLFIGAGMTLLGAFGIVIGLIAFEWHGAAAGVGYVVVGLMLAVGGTAILE